MAAKTTSGSDIEGRRLISIDQIDYDVDNPRIQLAFDHGREKTEASIKLALGADSPDEDSVNGTTIHGLKNSIRANRGIIHPIIVRKKNDGRYLVIEGNTRLMIYREFREKNFEGDWSKILCLVYDGIDQTEVDAIRLQSHLVGPRQWSPYAKARYLAQLERRNDVPWEVIVSFCGGNSRDVGELVAAYYDMENTYRKIVEEEDARFDPSRFSTFVVLQQKRVSEALLDAGFTKKDYARWVYDRKIFPSQDARQIPRILKSPKATELFLSEGSKAALSYLNAFKGGYEDKKLDEATVEQLARELTQRLLKMTREEEASLKADPDGDVAQMLIQLESELTVLCNGLRDS